MKSSGSDGRPLVGRWRAWSRRWLNRLRCGGARCVRPRFAFCATLSVVFLAATASAGILDDAWDAYYRGQYDQAIELVDDALSRDRWEEEWRHIQMLSYLATGRRFEAAEAADAARVRHPNSIRILLLARDAYFAVGRADVADEMLQLVREYMERSPWRYTDAANRVAAGQFFLLKGADPKQVLELYFDQAKKQAPSRADAFVAAGELALSKSDYAMAANELQQALRLEKRNPDILLGLAKAFAPSDHEKAQVFIEQALSLNPSHVDSLLWIADRHIDAERYTDAETLLQRALEVDPERPLTWAYLAVIAHLNNHPDKERLYRRVALGWWERDPSVDHLIGKKLSQKYRFAEGAAFQRQALKFAHNHLPAKIQLSQDLLRLGREEEGWALARFVAETDRYNVQAYNLTELEQQLSRFQSLEADGLIVRMQAQEAQLYGQDVVRLLQEARQALCEKYQTPLDQPVVVEIFPRQQDFAIRTFGLPGGAGFLGVCFGNVITANSPASQGGNPSNWQAVLWHEFCHVVTLNKTRNKMPRWLSEGISVYEELQANAAWGQRMTPAYRAMILGEDFTPLSELSGAFLTPPSPMHLQFAYFESALAVEFLVERYGLPSLLRVLDELAVGLTANEALARHCGPLAELDGAFAVFARGRAEALGDAALWEKPTAEAPDEILAWATAHPDNYWAMAAEAQARTEQRDWGGAREVLLRMNAAYPSDVSGDCPRRRLAQVYRQLGDESAEYAVLLSLCQDDADATADNLRLMELAEARQEWDQSLAAGVRYLAVNPLTAEPYRRLAVAADRSDQTEIGVRARTALLCSTRSIPPKSTINWRNCCGSKNKRNWPSGMSCWPCRRRLDIAPRNNCCSPSSRLRQPRLTSLGQPIGRRRRDRLGPWPTRRPTPPTPTARRRFSNLPRPRIGLHSPSATPTPHRPARTLEPMILPHPKEPAHDRLASCSAFPVCRDTPSADRADSAVVGCAFTGRGWLGAIRPAARRSPTRRSSRSSRRTGLGCKGRIRRRCLHLRESSVFFDLWSSRLWQMAHRLPGQRSQLLLSSATTDRDAGPPRTDLSGADRSAIDGLSVHLHVRTRTYLPER